MHPFRCVTIRGSPVSSLGGVFLQSLWCVFFLVRPRSLIGRRPPSDQAAPSIPSGTRKNDLSLRRPVWHYSAHYKTTTVPPLLKKGSLWLFCSDGERSRTPPLFRPDRIHFKLFNICEPISDIFHDLWRPEGPWGPKALDHRSEGIGSFPRALRSFPHEALGVSGLSGRVGWIGYG